jgi:hypothetical protein
MIELINRSGLKNSAAVIDYIQKELKIKKSDQTILRPSDGKTLEPSYNLDEFLQD